MKLFIDKMSDRIKSKIVNQTIQSDSNCHVNHLWLDQQQVDLLPWRKSLAEYG